MGRRICILIDEHMKGLLLVMADISASSELSVCREVNFTLKLSGTGGGHQVKWRRVLNPAKSTEVKLGSTVVNSPCLIKVHLKDRNLAAAVADLTIRAYSH